MPGLELVEMIVVGRDAVLPGPIEVQPDAREGNPQRLSDAFRGQAQARGKGFLAGTGTEREPRGEPRHVDLAVVHDAALGLPWNDRAQLPKPVVGLVFGDEARRIDDLSACIVHEDGFARFEEGKLSRHGVCLIFAYIAPNRVLSPCDC